MPKILHKFSIKNLVAPYIIVNFILLAGQALYIFTRYKYINSVIPLWLTKPWGELQLADKSAIYYLPAIALALTIFGLVLILISRKYFIRYFSKTVFAFVTFSNIMIFYSIFRIILVASVPFDHLINPHVLNLAIPFLTAFLLAYFFVPVFIDYAKENNLVTNPSIHAHPAMILSQPSARGGGLVYAGIFLIVSLIFTGFRQDFVGLYLSIIMISLLSIVDDFQNTHVNSHFKLLENPVLRLLLLFVSVIPVILSGLKITFITNPLDKVGNVLFLDSFKLNIAGSDVSIISVIITLVWIVWLMNVLSWSNGIDGQFSGILGIASLIVAFLALRFAPLSDVQARVAIMSAISAGIAFGFIKYTWHPSQIMWGFGAMCAGLVLSVLSILIQGKLVTSVLIILIPFLDAVVTVVRRLIQGKNPFKGDRGHLHHLLLERGWNAKKIALFYWFTTAIFGIIGLVTAEKYTVQVVLFLGILVAFFIILLNLLSLKAKQEE